MCVVVRLHMCSQGCRSVAASGLAHRSCSRGRVCLLCARKSGEAHPRTMGRTCGRGATSAGSAGAHDSSPGAAGRNRRPRGRGTNMERSARGFSAGKPKRSRGRGSSGASAREVLDACRSCQKTVRERTAHRSCCIPTKTCLHESCLSRLGWGVDRSVHGLFWYVLDAPLLAALMYSLHCPTICGRS